MNETNSLATRLSNVQPEAETETDLLPKIHNMVTRFCSGLLKPPPLRLNLQVTKHPIEDIAKPTCYSQAMKSTSWHEVMQDEFNVLLCNGT